MEPVLRQIGFTAPVLRASRHAIPMTIDFTSGLYFHREGPGLLFGMADRSTSLPGSTPRSIPRGSTQVTAVAERRLPSLLEMGMAGGWKGYYEVTPDHNALIGEAPGVSRFLYATGFSGHGFLQAPAAGEIVRDLVLGAASRSWTSRPSPSERFAGRRRAPSTTSSSTA